MRLGLEYNTQVISATQKNNFIIRMGQKYNTLKKKWKLKGKQFFPKF